MGVIRKFIQKIFKKPVLWAAEKLSSSPDKTKIFNSLSDLLKAIENGDEGRGPLLKDSIENCRYIIFSDQHKGGRDAADDFRLSEKNYRAALDYYYQNNYTLISLGDAEELWENTPKVVIEKNYTELQQEALFQKNKRYHRIYGNHDLEWKYPFQQQLYLRKIFGSELKVPEGVLITVPFNSEVFKIFMAHGHQGDVKSDSNPFSTWVVAAIWTPIQRYLEISLNTTADSFELVDKHNIMMYEWSAEQKNLLFISGHTHKPVFASLDHIERLNKKLEQAKETGNIALTEKVTAELVFRQKEYAGKLFHKTMAIPTYFNSGCCCFSDGDITGIEIADGEIRLIKWEETDGIPVRKTLEYASMQYLFDQVRKRD